MSYIPKSIVEFKPGWVTYTVTFNDVNVAAAEEEIVLGQLPAYNGNLLVHVVLNESFAGGGADCEIDIGYGTSTNAWINAQSITFTPSPTGVANSDVINNGLRNTQDPTNLVATIRNTAGNLDVLTSGSVDVHFFIGKVK